jgi:hypothetical protein
MANVVTIQRIRSDGVVDVYDATQDVHKTGHLAVRPGGMLVFQEFQAASLPHHPQKSPEEREQEARRERERAVLAGRREFATQEVRRGPETRLPGEDAMPGVLPDAGRPAPEGAMTTAPVSDAEPPDREAEAARAAEDAEHERRAEEAREKARSRARGRGKEPAKT